MQNPDIQDTTSVTVGASRGQSRSSGGAEETTMKDVPRPTSLLTNEDDDDEESGRARGSGGHDFDLEWEAHFTSLKMHDRAVDMEWRDFRFTIGNRTILNGVSGEAHPEELIAILGPSGSGKTTLLNILAGRISSNRRAKKRLSGTLFIDGEVISPGEFRRNVAYVVQHEALFPTSTTREALEFSASLRLPRSFSRKERETLVNDMIESLGLKGVENSMVGGESIRGLSGGERKRVAIGVELVSSPSVLFLDEATSGLDSFSAWKVVKILRAIAATRTTILCSIHQPSSEVFKEFTSVILLCQGNVVYQGSTKDVDRVFRSHGLGVPPRSNAADHIIFLAQTRPLSRLPQDNDNTRRHRVLDKNGVAREEEEEEGGKDGGSPQAPTRARHAKTRFKRESGGGFLTQTRYLTVREWRGFFRDVPSLVAKFGAVSVLSTLVAVIFLHVGDQSKAGYTTSSHFGALVMITISAMFNNAQPAILTFPLERVVFVRERGTNTYGTVAYYLSKLLVEIPSTLASIVLALLITYWALDLGGNFFYLVGALFLLAEASISVALLVGSVASTPKQAMQMAPLVFVPQILFMGFFIRISQLPIWLQWVQYVVSTKYSVDLSALTVFNPSSASTPEIAASWQEQLEVNDINRDLAWLYVLVLLAIFTVFRVVSMILLEMRASSFE